MSNSIFVTVFTPTYNRISVLEKLYQSLCSQSYKHFEWVIVDDGSTDSTQTIVTQWVAEGKISINYFHKVNGGKNRAFNKGVDLAKGELFFSVDSDDILTDDALEELIAAWKNYNFELDGDMALICSPRGKNKTEPLNTMFPEGLEIDKFNNLYEKYGFKGDTAVAFKKSILEKYKFPEIDGENFISESYLFTLLSYNFKTAFINKIIYLTAYLPDGYTANRQKLISNNPKGYMLSSAIELQYTKSFLKKMKKSVALLHGHFLSGDSIWDYNPPKIMIFSLYVPSYILFLRLYGKGHKKNVRKR